MKKILCFIVFASLMLSIQNMASANIIFSDNFDSENGGNYALNYAGFTNWQVTNGTVDLIGANSPWDLQPGNGLYIDLDGSTNSAGLFSKAFTLTPGQYELSFSLAGSHRGTTEDVTVEVGDPLFFEMFELNTDQDFEQIIRHFTVPETETNVTLSFHNAGGDNIGALLDNVKLASIPEPASISLLGFGLFGLFGLRKRAR
jgi:hypothetical protein